VLAGVDAASTYCYFLAAEEHRDADTWGVHLLDAAQQGLNPDYTIADAGQSLRAGQKAAWSDTPCQGDVFHIQRQCEGLAKMLARLATGTTSRRKTLQAKTGRVGQRGPDDKLATQAALARQTDAQAHELARDIRTLNQWLSHDVLALAGPALATRQMLFDLIVEELARCEPGDARRIRPVRVALQNQRDTLLAFVGVLSTPSSSLVENLNSRLRTYFTLRRHVGGSYLDLLRLFLNHRRFLRSRRAERQGKSPRELMTGSGHPHWLTLLGLGPLQPQRA